MRRIAYLLLAAISVLGLINNAASAETRPYYGGTLRVMLQASPSVLDLPTNATPVEYWDLSRTLSLIGDTLVRIDAQGLPQPALAVAWHSDANASHWQFTLRRGVKFHDGSAATPAAIAQILGALHSRWIVRASTDSIAIDTRAPMPSLPAELALPRNLLLKRNVNGTPIGTGAFLVADWHPQQFLKLAAYEESWEGRPFVDGIVIEFGKALRDQAIALELGKTDVIEEPPQAANGSQPANESSSLSLPIELLALVFPANSRAIDPHIREALALSIDRKPIQSALLKGAGEPAAGILPIWMTGYSAVFSAQANPQLARALLADLHQGAPNLTYDLNYDPRDPQARLIAERIALNAREVGITVQVSLSGAEDFRLVRVVLPSPDPATSLGEVARQLGVPQPVLSAAGGDALDDLFQAERGLLGASAVIPLFHLPVATAVSGRVRQWVPDGRAQWSSSECSLADLWLADQHLADQRSAAPRSDLHPQAESQ